MQVYIIRKDEAHGKTKERLENIFCILHHHFGDHPTYQRGEYQLFVPAKI